MAVVKHALAAIVHKSQFHARSIGPIGPNRSAEALSRALSYLAPRSRLVIYALPVTRQEIEQKMDELAREYRDTRDPEIP